MRRITAVRVTEFIANHQPTPESVVVRVDGEEVLRLTPDEAQRLFEELGGTGVRLEGTDERPG